MPCFLIACSHALSRIQPGTLKANAWLLPFFGTITLLAPLLSFYVTKTKDVKWPVFFGFVFFSVSVIGFALSGTNANMGIAFNAVAGIGFAPVLILIMMYAISHSYETTLC